MQFENACPKSKNLGPKITLFPRLCNLMATLTAYIFIIVITDGHTDTKSPYNRLCHSTEIKANHILSGRCLKYGCKESSRESESRQPEDHWRVGSRGPFLKLINTHHKIASPWCQRLHWWVSLNASRHITPSHVRHRFHSMNNDKYMRPNVELLRDFLSATLSTLL